MIFLNVKIYFLSWARFTMIYKGANTHVDTCWNMGKKCIAARCSNSILIVLAYSFFQLIKKSDSSRQNKFKEQRFVGKDWQKICAYAAIISQRTVLIRAPWQLPDLMPFQQFLWGLVHVFKAALKTIINKRACFALWRRHVMCTR